MKEKCEVYLNNELLGYNKSDEFYIDIAESVKQIEVSIQLDSKQWCQVTIHDKTGVRGQVLKTHTQETTIGFIGQNTQTTTATMINGPILAGVWRATYEIEGETEKRLPLLINITQHQEEQLVDESVIDIMINPVVKNKSGWVKGDLHTHTIFSDGKMTREANLISAANQNLDFFVATDHQVVTHLWSDSDVAVYAGVELTTPLGHANFLGVNRLLTEDYGIDSFHTADNILKLIKNNRNNGLFSVNHPFLKPWHWQLAELPLEMIDSIEICNDPTFDDNTAATEKALSFWSVLWNDGWKIAGVGGSDSHLLPTESYPESKISSLIGDPATYVYVENLVKEDLLSAIKKGKTMLSRAGKITFSSLNSELVFPGQRVTTKSGTFEVSLENKQTVKFEWVLDGVIVKEDVGELSNYQYDFEAEIYHWLRVDIREVTGEFLGTLTPVYWHERSSKFVTWGEAYNGGK